MIQMVPVVCPRCQATLEVEPGRESIYCCYCGLHVLIDNSNRQTFEYRTIDEARIREAELEERVRMLEMQLEEKRNDKLAALLKPAVIAGSVITVAGVVLSMLGKSDGIIVLMMGVLFLVLALLVAVAPWINAANQSHGSGQSSGFGSRWRR